MGRWLVRLGYVIVAATIVAGIVESISAWGETSSGELAAFAAVYWLAGCAITLGTHLNGELPPGEFSAGKAAAALPLAIGVAYYGPTFEHFGYWWAMLLPHATYGLLEHTAALPHVPALIGTIVVAPFELVLTAFVSEMVVVAPFRAIFGDDSDVVHTIREHVGGVEVSDPA